MKKNLFNALDFDRADFTLSECLWWGRAGDPGAG